MKVTVTQLPDQHDALLESFEALANHVQSEKSELVLLPEMPFYPWLAASELVDPSLWQTAVDAHEEWMPRLASLGTDIILGSRPVLENNSPHNDAFVWQTGGSASFAHRKYYLPDEPGFWEATWYQRADQPSFQAFETERAKIGFMICSDLWYGEHARSYARQGVHILANPRATEIGSVEKWLAGGRTASVMSGAFALSSNRIGKNDVITWGGSGWITDPDGEVLARTSAKEPFASVDIDLRRAEKAKESYPRYVKE
jgi:N-carbamoylputrescine amidase